MSSVFVPESSGSPQQQKQPEQARPKRPRSSLACIRCRKKKVKCDFVQPTCGRCAIAGLPCSYATPPRRVDGHAFDQLGNHVEELKERMQKMQSELAMMKNNLHPFAVTNNTASNSQQPDDMLMEQPLSDNMALTTTTTSGGNDQSVTWKLSLSPSGLRIDTNIASVADLYRILLNGISQLNINNDSTTSLFNPESSSFNATSSTKRQQSMNNTSPNTSSTGGRRHNNNYLDTQNSSQGDKIWEVDDNEARKILQEKKNVEDLLPKQTLDKLMHSCYNTCFLAYQIVDKDTFLNQYMSEEGLDPLLANSINAWVSKHGCIYHHVTNNGSSSTSMGEVYFKNARQLLKKCFDISSPTTIHALLNLYMYQLSSERSSLAYLYIGLAIRMAQDLKFHKKEHMSTDLNQRETNKRLWWSAYWLDLCAALESNRPTMVDDKDCDLDYPVRLEHEDDETGYRIHFAVYSIKLMRIRKDITKHLPSEQSGQSLLSAISRLENALTNWMNELPLELHFNNTDEDSMFIFQKTGSFRDEACLILNIQYQTTWIMLHKFFLPKQDQTATPVALLSLNICTKSANLITRMLSIYSTHLNWCQFFYAMDGIIASVTIHQVNALSTEKEVSYLAQRNLIITANVLKESPLMYMVKICEIIESIEGFLKKNGLSCNIADLPIINEDIVNQQSISSVFHPTVFDNNSINMMNSPQSQHSSSTISNHTTNIRVPSQLSTSNNNNNNTTSNLFQQHQNTPPPSNAATAVAAGQTSNTNNNTNNAPNNNMYNMVESSMLFSDPTNLMGFSTGPTSTNTPSTNNSTSPAVDQILLRNMGFDLNSSQDNRMFMNYSSPPTMAPTSTQQAPFENNYYNTPTQYPNYTDLFGMQPHQTQQPPPQPQQFNNQQNFDANALLMNMDPATISLLYNNNNLQYNQFQPQDEDLLYGSNNRKRAHRDWEDPSSS